MAWGRSATWKHNESCHLFADDVEELHAFAAKLGLRRSWFQNKPDLPHYDLTANKRVQALRLGAVSVDRREMVAWMKQKRSASWTPNTA